MYRINGYWHVQYKVQIKGKIVTRLRSFATIDKAEKFYLKIEEQALK